MHAVYDELPEVLAELGLAAVDGVLFDLGVSSMQLDVRERGFAYAEDAPLDMRMDDTHRPHRRRRPEHLLRRDLARVLRDYGEEKFARQIAAAVVRERETVAVHHLGPPGRAAPRRDPGAGRRTGGHPAKRTFQALRIEVNDELAVLRRASPRPSTPSRSVAASW